MGKAKRRSRQVAEEGSSVISGGLTFDAEQVAGIRKWFVELVADHVVERLTGQQHEPQEHNDHAGTPQRRMADGESMSTEQNLAQQDIAVYRLAREFLVGVDPRVNDELLNTTVRGAAAGGDRPLRINAVYRQLLESAKSPNMKPSVIGDLGRLRGVLFGFSPRKVVERYGTDDSRLLKRIIAEVRPSGQVRQTSRSIWPQFCQTALRGAAFLVQFRSGGDFHDWVARFQEDERSRPILPMLLSMEIRGMGFALACDFLKELGFLDYCKPDVHLKRILPAVGLCESSEDYTVFKAVARIAKNTGTKPFEIDKLFWLIGSGKFSDSVNIGRHAEEFINYTVLARQRQDRARD